MSDNNKPWIVDVNTVNPWGICLPDHVDDETVSEAFGTCTYPNSAVSTETRTSRVLEFNLTWRRGNGDSFYGSVDATARVINWVFDTYDLPRSSTNITIDATVFPDELAIYDEYRETTVITNHAQERFETEAEAIEFAESQSIVPLITFNDGDYLFRAQFRQEVGGVWVDRNVGLQHVGNPIEIYTITDLENYYANALGPYDYPVFNRHNIYGQDDCETSLNITIFNIDEDVSSTITVDPDFQGVPGSSTVTIVDGDPVVSGTMLENGDGSITIADNGNISMRNDGSVFFLNESTNITLGEVIDDGGLDVAGSSTTTVSGTLNILDGDGELTDVGDTINNIKDDIGAVETNIRHIDSGYTSTRDNLTYIDSTLTVTGDMNINGLLTLRAGTDSVELTVDDLTRLKALLD